MGAGPRLERRLGLFETLLVVAGRPVELEAHLARLAASFEAAFGAQPPERLAELATTRCRGIELGRLRLAVAPGEAEAAVRLTTEAVPGELVFPSWKHGAELRSRHLPGGLGQHKWVDRRRLDGVDPAAVALLLDRDGEVLEADRASLFLVRDGVLLTPGDDGRILPGIARAATLAAAREECVAVRETRIGYADLREGEEVFLTGSVRGIEPVQALDGVPLPGPGELSGRLAARLSERWLGAPRGAARSPSVGAGLGQPAR